MTNVLSTKPGSVVSVQVGRVAPLGSNGVASGFVKLPTSDPVRVGPLGLTGDAQADPRVHGGPEKAVYFYPFEHYAAWRRDLPRHGALLVPGGFGENLTTLGFDEDQVCIGDVLRVGTAVLQVTQHRQPCFKLGLRFDDRQMPGAMQRNGRSGWYARVLRDGVVEQGAAITLLERSNPDWPVSRLVALTSRTAATEQDFAEMSTLAGLATHWRTAAAAAVERLRRPAPHFQSANPECARSKAVDTGP